MFSLDAQRCQWPRCTCELRLRKRMHAGQALRVRVWARDGAGLTTKRANEASVELKVMAVATQDDGGDDAQPDATSTNDVSATARNLQESHANMTMITEASAPEPDANSANDASATLDADAIALTQAPSTSTAASLVTFSKNPTFTTSTSITTTALVAPQAIVTASPQPVRTYLIDALSEDAPIGLELLHLHLPENITNTRFVELNPNGTHALRMLANGTVQVDAPLDTRMSSELLAEVRAQEDASQPLAIVRVRIRSMVAQFREWLERTLPPNGRIAEGEVRPVDARWLRVLEIPQALRPYASVHGARLTHAGAVLLEDNADDAGLERCFELNLQFREEERVRKRICARLPRRVWSLQVRWPLNETHHTFRENSPLPDGVLLHFDVSVLYPPDGTPQFELDSEFEVKRVRTACSISLTL